MASVRLLLTFSEAARRGSFAAAARELGLSPSAVVKGVARLEQELGVRLFQRTTRRVQLTQDGAALYERCRRVLDELAELESAAATASQVPTGTLRLDIPMAYGRQVLLPVLAKIVQQHPTVGLDVKLSDVFTDVIGSGVDAVVRVGEIGDSRLVARVFDFQHIRTYASPAYLQRRGRPQTLASLEKHECIRFRVPTTGRDRPWQYTVNGREVVVQPESRYVVNDGEALVCMALAGVGLIQAPTYMADAAVQAGQLIEVLGRFRPKPMPISLVFPSNRHVPLRLRLLIDALMTLKQKPSARPLAPSGSP